MRPVISAEERAYGYSIWTEVRHQRLASYFSVQAGMARRPDRASLTAAHKRLLAKEMLISLIVSMVMAGGVTWLVSDVSVITSGRFFDAYEDLFKTSIGASFGLVPGVTFGIRKGLRNTILMGLDRKILPRNLLLKTIVVGLAAAFLLGAPTACLLVHMLGGTSSTLESLVLFKIGYGAIFALVVTPPVIISALHDRCSTAADTVETSGR